MTSQTQPSGANVRARVGRHRLAPYVHNCGRWLALLVTSNLSGAYHAELVTLLRRQMGNSWSSELLPVTYASANPRAHRVHFLIKASLPPANARAVSTSTRPLVDPLLPRRPHRGSRTAMVTLVVATAADPASVGPASSFLAMPGWNPGPSIAVRFVPLPWLGTSLFVPFRSLNVRVDSWSGISGVILDRDGELRERVGAPAEAREEHRGRGRPGPQVGGGHGRARRWGHLPQPPHCRLQPPRVYCPPHR